MQSMADPEFFVCKWVFGMVDEFNNKSLTHGCYNYIKFTCDNDFFWRFFCHFQKKIWTKDFQTQNPWIKSPQNIKKSEKLPRITTACNMKGCLRFFYSHSLNTTKYGWIFLQMITTWATSQNIKIIKNKIKLTHGFCDTR